MTAPRNDRRVSTNRRTALRLLRTLTISSTVVTLGYVGFAQQRVSPQAETRLPSSHNPVSDAAREIIGASREVTPELHARALIVLIESNQIRDRSLKLKLAHEAFDTAATVSAPVRMSSGLFSLNTDSGAGTSGASYSLGLDRLSLQSRAIADIASLDPVEARNLIADLSIPEMPPVGCSQALVYKPSSYYDVLKILARDKKANRKDSKDTTEGILYPAVSNLQTHTQVGLAMALLSDSGLSKGQLESLTGTYVGQLSKMRGDERGLAAEIVSQAGITSSQKLYQALEKSDPGSGAPLLREFRQYLIDNYKAGGCGELWIQYQITGTEAGLVMHSHDQQIADKTGNKTLPDAIQKFNDEFREGLGRAKLDPVTVQDIDVNAPIAKAEVNNYWSDPETKAYLTAAQRLRFDENDQARTLSERESSAWRAQVVSYLGKIDDGEADPSNSVEVFNEKLELYTSVIDLTAKDDLNLLAIERGLSMLENSNVESEHQAQWLRGAMDLQLRASTLAGDIGHQKLKSDPDFTTRLINSKNRSLHLIGLLGSLHLDPFNSKGGGISLP